MHQLLEKTKAPLSFIIAVAHWDHPEVHALRASPYARVHALVPAESQRWLDGSTARRAPVDLLLIALQNTAASADPALKATDQKFAALRDACIGDATPLGPRKHPRGTNNTGANNTANASQADQQAKILSAVNLSSPRKRLPRPRPPLWRVAKLRRLV